MTAPFRRPRKYDQIIQGADLDTLTSPTEKEHFRVGCPSCHAEPGDPCLMSGKSYARGQGHVARFKLVDRWLELCGALPW